MRRLALGLALALLLGLISAAPARAAITIVQTVTCTATAVNSCTTPATTTTSGNLVITPVGFSAYDVLPTTDNLGNTFAVAIPNTGGGGHLIQYYATGITGGSGHTFNCTAADGQAFYCTMDVHELSGATASPLDQVATATIASGTTSFASANTATTAQADEFLIGMGYLDTTPVTVTQGSGWTALTQYVVDGGTRTLVSGSRTVSATGAYNYAFTTNVSTTGDVGISTWKATVAAPATRSQCIGCGADRKVLE